MDKNKLTAKQSGLAFLIGFLVFQLGSIFVLVIGTIIASCFGVSSETLTNFFSHNALGYMILAVSVDLCLVLSFLYFNKNSENQIVSKPKLLKVLIYILVAVASFFMLCPIINSLDFTFDKIGINSTPFPYQITLNNILIATLSFAVMPAICEELLFRGVIFKGLKRYGKAFSIIASAVMFAIFHMSINQFLYPLLIGLLLGVIMHKENNILYCIIVHFVNNFLTIVLKYFDVLLFVNSWWFYLLAILLLGVFTTLIFILVFNKQSKKEKFNKNDKQIFLGCMIVMLIIWTICLVAKFI